jgi:hypothetical protein
MKGKHRRAIAKIPDFDVILENIERTALIIKEQLETSGYTKIGLIEHAAIGEIVPRHIEIKIGKESIAFLYEPIACHAYNKVNAGERIEIKVATIDTILTFYLAFLYTKQIYYYKDRLLCIAKYLFDLQEENRLSQRGLLKRFSMDCYGKQPTLEDMRAEKAAKYAELTSKKGDPEYDEWFLNYKPSVGKKQTKLEGKLKSLDSKVIIKSPRAQSRKVKMEKLKPKKTRRNKVKKEKENEYLF